MIRSLPKVLFFCSVLLAVTLSGLGRILPAAAGSAPAAPQPLDAAVGTPSPTVTTTALPPTAAPLIPFPTEVTNTTLLAFIQAPSGPVSLPYVTITGFQSGTYSTNVRISGTINTSDFICNGSPCTIPLQLGESRFIFHAETPTGLIGDTVYATVLAELKGDGYHVTIESVSQFARVFSDACLRTWNVEDVVGPSWAEFPSFPYELHTDIPLHHLAARLITYGLVDTRDCPAGGLSQDLDWPNGCGMTKATDKMIEWQNQYDDAIWTAAANVGIPPKILKTLIEVESQFWPANSRFYLDEYGLGQVNQLGVDMLLRKDPNMYQQVCSAVLTNCNAPYGSLPAEQQRLVRGALMTSLDATCASCQFGLDLTKAKQSINFIAQLLRSNCETAKDVLESRGTTTDYESYWKFTLLSYHSGLTCLSTAVKGVKYVGDPMDWNHLSDQITCPGGRKYVDNFWANLELFDTYRYSPGSAPLVQFSPVFAPTHTPLPSPTPVISNARVQVTVYMDMNGNGTPEPNEGLNGIPVQLVFPDGRILSAVTSSGQASFDMSGYVAGTQITATLPNLYRNYRFYLPESGVVPIVFVFAQPTLPGKLP